VVVSLLETGLVRFDNYYKRLFEAFGLLDSLNTRILKCMAESGPRNLLEVSRRTGIPFTTVYHRVNKFEKHVGRVAELIPTFSKLGLACMVVIGKAAPGSEEELSEALKVPNYWWSITRCEGGFTHHSFHCVPVEHVAGFNRYLKQLSRRGLMENLQIIRVGDLLPLSLDFRQYDTDDQTWHFVWDKWFRNLLRQEVTRKIDDPTNYNRVVDKHDLFIVKELQKNGRTTLARMAPKMGMTVPGVKYHYDKLVARGACKNFSIDVSPYPIEISAIYDIMLDFPNRERMNKFFSYVNNLFFFLDVTKVMNKNSLLLRAYVPESL
jgi:DNA-binding Lrp family transcriptional regulator